jgi:gamma-glutamylcyclotransferase (GGCT)/AIG2-like uncharacterized protein YtfP
VRKRRQESGGGRQEPGGTWLFVYGTLMRAERMARVLANGNRWRYAGPATVRGELYELGRYRALRLGRSGSCRVEGLLVELEEGGDALRRLDAYEETGAGLYERRRCRARMESGERRPAWVYVGGRC